MKKILLLILLLILPTTAFSSNNKQLLLEVDRLGQAVDNCAFIQKEERKKAEQKNDSIAIQRLNYDLIHCYHKIADETFNLFYEEKAAEMKTAFSNFISAASEWNSLMYNYNNTCYHEKKHLFCGLVADSLSSAEAADITRDSVLRMLIYTEKRLR